ncbi:hypothetical protein JHK84_043659 [Glycine max]|nr:hypothetical protein JHK86_043471 [Glycine max]KAG5117546.1 hypothetical protein JHK84_043659 [Glycine max]
MRRKSKGKRRRAAPATTLTSPSLSAIPILSDEHNNNAPTAFDTDCDDDNNALHHRGSEPEPEPELEPVDIFDKTICIHCDNKGEEAEGVLICGGRGCPVAVHATCLGFEPEFDDSGNFCCPYCWYKRAVDTCRRLREKAMKAKGELSRFFGQSRAGATDYSAAARVDPVVQDSEELMEETETEEQSEENKDEEGMVEESEKLVEGKETESEENKEEVEGKVQDSEELVEEMETETEGQTEENKDEEGEARVGADSSAAARKNPVQDGEEIVVEGMETELEAQSGENKDEEGKVRDSGELVEEMERETGAEVQPEENKDEGKVQDSEELLEETETETEGQSEEKKDEEGKVAVMSSSVSETNDSESVAEAVKKRKDQKKKKVASSRKSLSRQQEHKNKHYKTRGKFANKDEEEVTSFKSISLRQQPQRMKQSSLTAKRRRLLWTAEEEKVLKEGVSKFSTENQNIPWRKILEFGCRVFDKTRTPVDLKDKWKNIISKKAGKCMYKLHERILKDGIRNNKPVLPMNYEDLSAANSAGGFYNST